MKEISYNFLRKIGLTESEVKVYLALIRLGTSSKANLIRESKITSSKVYEVTDRLIDKGLCSTIIKNGVKYFMAAHPVRIRDYLRKKQEDILQEETELDKIMPHLQSQYDNIPEDVKIEVFMGWKGVETVYINLLDISKKDEEVYIIGAGTGKEEKKLELFYTKYGSIAFKKGLKIRVIFNENAREYIKKIEKNIGKNYNKRFLFDYTPTEILIFRNLTAILFRREEPIIVLIKDDETANSFREYFTELWNISKR